MKHRFHAADLAQPPRQAHRVVELAFANRRLHRGERLASQNLIAGGVAAIAVAYAGARLILHLAFTGPDAWVPVDATPSTPVLLFALGISVITGVVFGIAPAWMTSHAEPIEALRGANRSVGGNRHWAQKTLVIVQAAVSLVLLSVAAMLFFLLLRAGLAWYADSRLRIPRFHLREHALRAGVAFFSAPEIKQ